LQHPLRALSTTVKRLSTIQYITFAFSSLLGAVACGLTDVFAAPGRGNVVFVWQGSTDLVVGMAVPLRVEVQVDGAPLDAPRLTFEFPDQTRITYASTTDSILPLRPGRGEMVARLESSLATTPLDTLLAFQVRP
jgi:hypothetical protein